MTASIASHIIEKRPYLVDDDEINPLMQRMSVVERLLNERHHFKKESKVK